MAKVKGHSLTFSDSLSVITISVPIKASSEALHHHRNLLSRPRADGGNSSTVPDVLFILSSHRSEHPVVPSNPSIQASYQPEPLQIRSSLSATSSLQRKPIESQVSDFTSRPTIDTNFGIITCTDDDDSLFRIAEGRGFKFSDSLLPPSQQAPKNENLVPLLVANKLYSSTATPLFNCEPKLCRLNSEITNEMDIKPDFVNLSSAGSIVR